MKKPATPINLDEFRWNLAAAHSIAKVVQVALESGTHDFPPEALWRTAAVGADLAEQCLTEFDSDAFEAAWTGKAELAAKRK